MDWPKPIPITNEVHFVPCKMSANRKFYKPLTNPYDSQDDFDLCRGRNIWKPEEDEILRDIVNTHGPSKWSRIAKELNFRIHDSYPVRRGKQCRERWLNHLNPSLLKVSWSKGEDEKIVAMQKEIGNKWSEISRVLKGRTENQVKNRWKCIKKKKGQNDVGPVKEDTGNLCKSEGVKNERVIVKDELGFCLQDIDDSTAMISEIKKIDNEVLETEQKRAHVPLRMSSLTSDPDLDTASKIELERVQIKTQILDPMCYYKKIEYDKGETESLYQCAAGDGFTTSLCWDKDSFTYSFTFSKEECDELKQQLENRIGINDSPSGKVFELSSKTGVLQQPNNGF